MKMPVYCGYRLLSLFFVFAGIKRWQGQSILVCVYAALFLPCSACYFFLYFCAPLYFFLCFPSPCVFVLDSVFFWVDCSVFLGFFLCLQGQKQWLSQYSYLSCSFTFPSLFCVLFFCSVFLLSVFALVFSVFWVHLLLLLCSAFYKAQRACPSNQSWICRTVIPPRTGLWAENMVTIGSGFAADFPASLLNRNEEDARLFLSNGAVSTEMEIFTLTPKQFKLNNWDPNQ